MSATGQSASEPSKPFVTRIPSDINTFTRSIDNLYGFDGYSSHNIKYNLRKKEHAAGSKHDFMNFSIGSKPAVRPGDRYVAVGTDEPEAVQHFLSIIDVEIVLNDGRVDPVVCYLSVSEHMSDVKWLNSQTILASTGKGNLKMFQFNRDAKTLSLVGEMKDAAGSYTREIGVDQFAPNNVAIGGFDHKLNLLDLNRPDAPYLQRLDMQAVIGSIKWSPFNASQLNTEPMNDPIATSSFSVLNLCFCLLARDYLSDGYVSCTLDEGKYYLFDQRTKITQSTFYMDLKKSDLFCHERFNDFQVLLGFGDGKFKHIDMRQPKKVLHTEQDPFVDAIGNIEYNTESDAFVVSGYTESVSTQAKSAMKCLLLSVAYPILGASVCSFSVYRIRNGEAKIWSHSEMGEDSRKGKGWAGAACWYDNKKVLNGDNAGSLGVFLQDFEQI